MDRRLVGAIGAATVALVASGCSSSGTAVNLRAGDCLNLPESSTVYTIDTLSCNSDHDAEVFYTFSNEDADTYPGTDVLTQTAETRCAEQFESYVGTPYVTSTLDMQWFLPSEESWATGDRETACVAFPLDQSQLSSTIHHSNV